MNCPNCGAKIEENKKFCTSCGAKIEISEDKLPVFKQLIKSNKIFLVSFLIGVSVFVLCLSGFALYNSYNNKIDISLIKLDQDVVDYSTAEAILNTLIVQDNVLVNYVQKNYEPSDFNKLFEIFYRNTIAFTGRETELKSKLGFNSYDYEQQRQFTIDYVDIQKNKNGDYSSYIIIKPNTELVRFVYSGEGYWSAEINYNYLVAKYSSYLSGDWQEFLELKQKEFKYKNGCSYNIDGAINPTKAELADWLIAETRFLNKYPHFALKDIMKADLKNYTSDFIEDVYQTFVDDPPILLDEAKTAYEKFLANADKNTEEYKRVKEWYEVLKKDDFKQSLNYFKYKYELTGNEDYKTEYDRIKAEDELFDNFEQ